MNTTQLSPLTERPLWLGQPLTTDQPYDLLAVQPSLDSDGHTVVTGACQGVNHDGTPGQVRPTSYTLLSAAERELAIAALLAHRALQGQVMARNVAVGMALDFARNAAELGLVNKSVDRPYWVIAPARTAANGLTEITFTSGMHQPSVTLWIDSSAMLDLAGAR
jgi:hypothetical protein